MTGIAGKSKGCITCRRRKVRCGHERPNCQNCTRTGRRCEGYERYPVFINRTAAGTQKRDRLAEAKPRSTTTSESGSRRSSNTDCQPPAVPSHQTSRQLEQGLFRTGFISNFYEAYSLPTRSSIRKKTYPGWLYYAVSIANPVPVLQQALLALSTTRCGRMREDPLLVHEGQRLYSQALQMLQKTLYDSELALDDEVLVAVRTMVLYEVFEVTSSTLDSWDSHIAGTARLLELRGPTRHRTAMCRAVLEEFRYVLMVNGVLARKASRFGEQDWIEAPWEGEDKSVEQHVLDKGLLLASILQRSDELAQLPNGPAKLNWLIAIITDCNELSNELLSIERVLEKNSDPGFRPSDEESMALLTLLGLKLVVMMLSNPLTSRLGKLMETNPLIRNPHLQLLVEKSREFSNEEMRLRVARKILETVPQYLNSAMGLFSASRTIMPLKCAYLQFQNSETERLLCGTLLKEVSQRRGFRFSSHIGMNQISPIIRAGMADSP